MEYKKVLSSAVIGYDTSDDDEIIQNSPDQRKHITVPQSPNIDEMELEVQSEIIPKFPDDAHPMNIPDNHKFSFVPGMSPPSPSLLLQNEQRSIEAPAYSPLTPRPLLKDERRNIEAPPNSPITPGPLLQNEQHSVEAPAYSPLTPRPLLQNEHSRIEAPAHSPLTLQNEQRSIEEHAYSQLTPGPLLQNIQRSIEAPAHSPLTLQNEQRSIEEHAYSQLTPGPLLQNDQRSIEAPAHSPFTFQNEQRSIEEPAYTPLTPGPLLQNEQRSIEEPAYSPPTPEPLLQNEQRSIEAPAYSPLTPRPRPLTRQLKKRSNLDFSTASKAKRVSLSKNNKGIMASALSCVSPLPPMSPETRTALQILENDVYNSDDSVKDPDYEVDEDETDCSDIEDRRTSFRTFTVEAEIHRIKPTNKSSRKQNHEQSNDIIMEANKTSRKQNHEQSNNIIMEAIDKDLRADNEKDVEKNSRRTTERNEEQAETDHCALTTEVETLRENELLDIRQGRAKKGRKRKGLYSRNEIKQRKFNNLPYTNRKHKLIKPKEFQNCQCFCKKNCSTLVNAEERRKEFDTFMNLGSFTAQILFINSSVEEFQKKRSYQPDPKKKSKPKQFTRTYKLRGKTVCKQMYLKTLQITTQKVNTAMKKKRNDALTDQRGATGGWNKLPSEEYKLAENIINKLPKYESHYRRESTEAVYLQPGMTVRKIYEDYYLKEFNNLPDKDSRRCLKYGTFKEFFYKNFNLKCKPLKKDTCNKCDYFATAKKNGVDLQDEHDAHLKKAQGLRKQMKMDFERAQNEQDVECLTFDLEKTLPLPRIPTNVVFYKRQLWVYNSGIHRASDDRGFCYVWVEGEAGRGAQEVASCLLQFMQNELSEDKEHLILWSDSCGGQNRNIKLTLMLKAALNSHKTLKTISMRFLEPGHTFLPNDTDFSKIETKIKEYDRIYTAEDYMNIMKRCKIQKPLNVRRMTSDKFLGCSSLENGIVNRKVYKDKNKVNWLITKEILLKKDFKYSIFMRPDFDSNFNELFIQKRLGRGAEGVEIITSELNPLWPNGKEIAKAKLDDLKSMLHLIPMDCRSFYDNLRGSDLVFDDVDRFGTIPDFEVEGED